MIGLRARILVPVLAGWALAGTGADSSGATMDSLAGDLPPVLFAKDRPYLVVGDIYVPQGKKVSIEAGAVLLFRSFTGMQVQGTLTVKGTAQRPVVFTSANDREYNPGSGVDAAPYDWNGLYLHPEAIGTVLSHCCVYYSVDGISAMTRFFRLSPGLLRNNGRANLTVEGVQHQVTDQPYEYALTKNDPSLGGIPLSILRDPRAPRRNALRYAGLSLAVGGGALGIVYAERLHDSVQRLRSLSSTDPDNLAHNSGSDWVGARTEKNADLAATVLGLSALIVGGAGVGMSFTF